MKIITLKNWSTIEIHAFQKACLVNPKPTNMAGLAREAAKNVIFLVARPLRPHFSSVFFRASIFFSYWPGHYLSPLLVAVPQFFCGFPKQYKTTHP